MPAQHGIWLEQEQHSVQFCSRAASRTCETGSENRQGEFLQTRNVELLRMLTLENAQLLTKDQYLHVLVVLGVSVGGEQVKQ